MYDVVRAESGRLHRAFAGAVQERAMARAYRVTDPEALAEKLGRAGWLTEIRGTLFQGRRSSRRTAGWRHIVVARERRPLGMADPYARGVSFLCAHNGRVAFAAHPEVVRIACENQFVGAPIKVRHTDPDIDGILEDPVPFARRLLSLADVTRDRLETLQGIGCGADLSEALRPRRRLHKVYREALCGTSRYGAHDLHTALQTLTQTKSPTLVKAAHLALTDFYGEFLQGEVSQGWAEAAGLAAAERN